MNRLSERVSSTQCQFESQYIWVVFMALERTSMVLGRCSPHSPLQVPQTVLLKSNGMAKWQATP